MVTVIDLTPRQDRLVDRAFARVFCAAPVRAHETPREADEEIATAAAQGFAKT